MKWLSIGSIVAAVAFLNYRMFPSRFTQLLYGGEILWLGAILTLLYGAVREISNTEAELVRTRCCRSAGGSPAICTTASPRSWRTSPRRRAGSSTNRPTPTARHDPRRRRTGSRGVTGGHRRAHPSAQRAA